MYLSLSQTKEEMKSAITYVFIPNLPSFSPPWNAVADFTPQGEKTQIITSVRQYGLKKKLCLFPEGVSLYQRGMCVIAFRDTKQWRFLKGTSAQNTFCHAFSIWIRRQHSLWKALLTGNLTKMTALGKAKNPGIPFSAAGTRC